MGQNIFHRPASSGQYAVVANLDLYKVGRNDITLEYDLDGGENGEKRRKRVAALLRSLIHTFLKPTGAHRNTQNPHVLDFMGVIATSISSVPAPSVSALNVDYRQEIEKISGALNTLNGGAASINVRKFDGLAQFAEQMAAIVREVEQ